MIIDALEQLAGSREALVSLLRSRELEFLLTSPEQESQLTLGTLTELAAHFDLMTWEFVRFAAYATRHR